MGLFGLFNRKNNVYETSKQEKSFISLLFNNQKIIVQAENDDVTEEYINECIKFFENLNENAIETIINGAWKYYNIINEISNLSEMFSLNKNNKKEILDYIYPHNMWVYKSKSESVSFIVECECEWYGEGLEIVVLENSIVNVGQYEGDIEQYIK